MSKVNSSKITEITKDTYPNVYINSKKSTTTRSTTTRYVVPITYTGDGTDDDQNTYLYQASSNNNILNIRVQGIAGACGGLFYYGTFSANRSDCFYNTIIKGGNLGAIQFGSGEGQMFNYTDNGTKFYFYAWQGVCNIRGSIVVEVEEIEL